MASTVCPKLSSEVVIRVAGKDTFLAQHQRLRTQLPVPNDHHAALRAMDGEHSLEQLESLLPSGSGTLTYRALALLLFQLWDRGLLENEEEVRAALFPHHTERTLDRELKWRGLRNLISSSMMGPPLSKLLVGRAVLAVQALLTLLAVVAVFGGQVPWPDNLFQLSGDWVTGSVLAYLSIVFLLSLRGLVRATILAAEGSGLRQVGVRHIVGIVYFDVDDREVYHLDPDLQVRFSMAGLLSTTSVSGFLVVSGLAAIAPWATNIAALGLAIGFVNLCPFFATDGARLVEHLSGLSRQRFRVRSFIAKELVRGLVSPAAGTGASWHFSAVATVWFLWFFGAVKLAVLVVVNHMTILQSVVLRAESTMVAVICGLLLAYTLGLVLVMAWGLIGVSFALVTQVFARRRTDAPDGTQGVAALSPGERANLVSVIGKLTTGGVIPDGTLDEVLGGVQQVHFPAGAWILRAGNSAPTYYWVLDGRVELRHPLPEGDDILIAILGPGESFGPGLEADGRAEHDALAAEGTTILALDTGRLRAVVDAGGDDAAGVRGLLDRLSFLATVPELAALGPSARLDLASRASDLQVGPDESLIRQGDEADALYLVRSGRVKVVRQGDSGEVFQLAELGSGSTFGEMGLLFKRPRMASVTSVEDSHLIRVPRDVLEDVLKRCFHVGLALEDLASSRRKIER
jgi:CRP-like cAMP-binding protein